MANTAELTQSIYDALAVIRGKYPELPDMAVVIVDSDKFKSRGRRYTTLGYFWARQWSAGSGNLPELCLSSLLFASDYRPGWAQTLAVKHRLSNDDTRRLAISETLLHECCHALAFARRVKDTSANGRYHNKRFLELAQSLGLVTIMVDSRIGYGTRGILDEYVAAYRPFWSAIAVNGLGGLAQLTGATSTREKGRQLKGECECGRIIRGSREVLTGGAITCGLCGSEFALVEA